MDLKVRKLLDSSEFNTIDGNTYLGKLVIFSTRYPELVIDIEKYCKENPCEVNVENSKGWTPLFIAADRKNYKVLRVLLENGANVNYVSTYGNVMSITIGRKYLEINKLLLEYDCLPNALYDHKRPRLSINKEETKEYNKIVANIGLLMLQC